MTIKMLPADFPMPFGECPPGFFLYDGMVGLKSEYGDDAYCDTGEAFWGGTSVPAERAKLMVTPLKYEIDLLRTLAREASDG